MMGYLQAVDGSIDNSDIRWYATNATAQVSIIEEYLNIPEVREALHIPDTFEPFKM
jgi:hypothetical protein